MYVGLVPVNKETIKNLRSALIKIIAMTHFTKTTTVMIKNSVLHALQNEYGTTIRM